MLPGSSGFLQENFQLNATLTSGLANVLAGLYGYTLGSARPALRAD